MKSILEEEGACLADYEEKPSCRETSCLQLVATSVFISLYKFGLCPSAGNPTFPCSVIPIFIKNAL